MKWDWLNLKRIGVSFSWKISEPDASRDKCLKCGVERRYHKSDDHLFKEKEDE